MSLIRSAAGLPNTAHPCTGPLSISLCWFLEAPCPRSVDVPAVSMQRMMGFFAVALRPQYSCSQHSLTIPIKGPATLLEFCQVARCQLQLLSGTGKPAASPQCQGSPVPPKQDQRKPNSFKQNNPNLFLTLSFLLVSRTCSSMNSGF